MAEVGFVLLVGAIICALYLAIAATFTTLLWIVLLPVRLVLWLLGTLVRVAVALVRIPLSLLRFCGRLIARPFQSLPVLGATLMVVAVTASALLVPPLLPFTLLGAVLWYLLRRRPAAAGMQRS